MSNGEYENRSFHRFNLKHLANMFTNTIPCGNMLSEQFIIWKSGEEAKKEIK